VRTNELYDEYFTALGITLFVLVVTPEGISNSIVNAVELSSYSLSVVTTLLSTVIIVTRILMVSRMPGASRQSRIAMEIIVESAALYAISGLVNISMLSYAMSSATVFSSYLYADLCFAYMAVESHLSSIALSPPN
jgi:hypothetical protein